MIEEGALLTFKANTSELSSSVTTLNKVTAAGKTTDKTVGTLGYTFVSSGRSVRAFSAETLAASKSLQSTTSAAASAQTGMARLRGASSSAIKSFRVQKGATQQLGYQFQDVAVQAQMGTNAFTIFAQQGSQMASVFGPGGALVGAVLAIGAAIGGTLFASMLDSKTATEELEEALKALDDTIKITKDGTILLSDEFEILAGKSRQMAEVQLKARLVSALNASKAAFSQLSEATDDFDKSLEGTGRRAASARISLKRLSDKYGITTEETKELIAAQKKAFETKSVEDAQAFASAVSEVALSNENANDEFIGLAQSANTYLREIQTAADITTALKSATDDLTGSLKTNTEAAQAAAEVYGKAYGAALQREQEEEIKALEAAHAAEDKKAALAEKAIQRQEKMAAREAAIKRMGLAQNVGFAAQNLSIIEDAAKENSAVQKAAFVAQKAINIATMIMNTEAAAAAALLWAGPAGPVVSNIIRGLGYAGVGAVAGQAIASFEGGGMTPVGARAGGMDGKGGMLAMLHPNEKVTDLTKGDGGSGIEVINNIKVVGGSRDAEVTTTTSQVSDKKVIQNIVIDMLSVTGKGFKQLQQNSNLTARGIR